MANVIYIHGFTSWPGTSKGTFFKRKLAECELPLHLPDFNVPTFETLTLTAQIQKLAEAIDGLPDEPVYLIGSSLGGGVTVHFMNSDYPQKKRVEKIVLLAPALDFIANRQHQLGADGLKRWKATGFLPVRHYADGQVKNLHYGLMDDLEKYDSFGAKFNTSTLIIHGLQDESVAYEQSLRFTKGRKNVRLTLLNADHSLESVFEEMWTIIKPFLI